MELSTATWVDVAESNRGRVLVVPMGSVEQHGPHLPLDTDTRVAIALAHALAQLRDDVVVAPAVPYGASGEHADFPGTLLLDHDVLAQLVIELVRSARSAFRGVVLVSGHGGNLEALNQAARVCTDEGDEVVLFVPQVENGDAHAGRTETSLLLALDPSAVRLERAETGATEPLEELMPRLRAEGVRPISSNGVLGDPAGASAEEGRALLARIGASLAERVEARWPSSPACS